MINELNYMISVVVLSTFTVNLAKYLIVWTQYTLAVHVG